MHGEMTEKWGSGGDADRHVEAKPAFCAFRRSTQNADAFAPYLIDAPTERAVTVAAVKGGGTASGQGIVAHDGHNDFRALAICPAPTTLRLAAAASSRDSRARLSVVRRLPRPISNRASNALASKGHRGAPAMVTRCSMYLAVSSRESGRSVA